VTHENLGNLYKAHLRFLVDTADLKKVRQNTMAPKRNMKASARPRRSPVATSTSGSNVPAVQITKMVSSILVFAQAAPAAASFTYAALAAQWHNQYSLKAVGAIPPVATVVPTFKYIKLHWIKSWGGIEKDVDEKHTLVLSARGTSAPPSTTTFDAASGTSDRAFSMIKCDPELYWESTANTSSAFVVTDTALVHVKASFWS